MAPRRRSARLCFPGIAQLVKQPVLLPSSCFRTPSLGAFKLEQAVFKRQHNPPSFSGNEFRIPNKSLTGLQPQECVQRAVLRVAASVRGVLRSYAISSRISLPVSHAAAKPQKKREAGKQHSANRRLRLRNPQFLTLGRRRLEARPLRNPEESCCFFWG